MLSCPRWGAQIMSSHRFTRLGLLYAAIPVVAGASARGKLLRISSMECERRTATSSREGKRRGSR
jgi:hypothetical protein